MRKNILPIAFIVLLSIVVFYFFYTKQINTPTPSSSPISQATPSPNQNGATISGVFEGITPCSNVDRPLPQIPSNANCEMTIWHITFNQDSTYTLNSSYGMTQPNTPGIKGGGTRINMGGNWTIIEGTKSNPEANVIQLHTDNPQTSLSFIKVTDNIIHLLGSDKNMMIGNGGWSYTLSKTSR